jgi:hypothetical protein
LLVLGVVALLQSLRILPVSGNLLALIVAVAFLAAGLSFLLVLFQNRSNWWAAIPGFILADLGLLIVFSSLFPQNATQLGGAFFLAGISLAFWVVYILSRRNWWAIIPGGVLATLALEAGLKDFYGIESSLLFFFGLAATFAVLAILPTGERRMSWPWIPAGALLLVAMIVSLSTSTMVGFLWPAVLILGGLFLLFNSILKR